MGRVIMSHVTLVTTNHKLSSHGIESEVQPHRYESERK